jgi:hypothetical protein
LGILLLPTISHSWHLARQRNGRVADEANAYVCGTAIFNNKSTQQSVFLISVTKDGKLDYTGDISLLDKQA